MADCSDNEEKGITPSIGMRFGQIKTFWKGNFVHLAWDPLVAATSVLDREENP
jgi:hypothetical protein